MSTCLSIGCIDCESSFWCGQMSLGGHRFYSGDLKVMAELGEFLAKHMNHRLEYGSTQTIEMTIEELKRPPAQPKGTV